MVRRSARFYFRTLRTFSFAVGEDVRREFVQERRRREKDGPRAPSAAPKSSALSASASASDAEQFAGGRARIFSRSGDALERRCTVRNICSASRFLSHGASRQFPRFRITRSGAGTRPRGRRRCDRRR